MTWEQRWHPLRREWVIVAAHRQHRPWHGETVEPRRNLVPSYDAGCHLCPGNRRVSGALNPEYRGVFVFDNDHPCVGPGAPPAPAADAPLYRSRPAHGLARVLCYSPRHNLALAQLDAGSLEALVETWQAQYLELGSRPEVEHVFIFENRGEAVGVSNPHPHCQLYATNFVVKTIEVELEAEAEHLAQTGRGLMEAIVESELEQERRVVLDNQHAVAFLPYFARYSYETYVVPRRRCASIAELTPVEARAFGQLLQQVAVRFDNLWQMPFPYVMALHQAPTNGQNYDHHHFHVQFQPPLRAPHLLKHLAGPEVGGGCFLSDSAPEDKAAELRAAADVHYLAAAPPGRPEHGD